MAHAFRNSSDEHWKLSVMQVKPEAGDPIKELSLIQKYAGEAGIAVSTLKTPSGLKRPKAITL